MKVSSYLFDCHFEFLIFRMRNLKNMTVTRFLVSLEMTNIKESDNHMII
jgi:hypothetical protein